jgi:hypothetical protein
MEIRSGYRIGIWWLENLKSLSPSAEFFTFICIISQFLLSLLRLVVFSLPRHVYMYILKFQEWRGCAHQVHQVN